MQLIHLQIPFLLLLRSATATPGPQVAAGGGVAATTLAPSQNPTVYTANSLYTLNGVTTASYGPFTQTFASTALGTWDLGPTPLVGSIGLGTILGSVGGVPKSKRGLEAVETPGPKI